MSHGMVKMISQFSYIGCVGRNYLAKYGNKTMRLLYHMHASVAGTIAKTAQNDNNVDIAS